MKRTAFIVGLLVWTVAELSALPPDRFEQVRALIQEKMKKESLPSMAVAVAQNGQIIWEEAWGLANIEKQILASGWRSFVPISSSRLSSRLTARSYSRSLRMDKRGLIVAQ